MNAQPNNHITPSFTCRAVPLNLPDHLGPSPMAFKSTAHNYFPGEFFPVPRTIDIPARFQPAENLFPEKFQIPSPKRETDRQTGKNLWFKFYAGYSFDFAESIIRSAGLTEKSTILDPWNGSGTTTTAAAHCGIKSVGVDRNPVMLIAAKARLISHMEENTLRALAKAIIKQSSASNRKTQNDALSSWFSSASVSRIRTLDATIRGLTVDIPSAADEPTYRIASLLSPSSAFFYLALFNSVRKHIHQFKASNPTWIKKAKTEELLNIPASDIAASFLAEVDAMLSSVTHPASWLSHPQQPATILLGDSRKIPLEDESISLTLTSPPYCTRIDYAVATSPELAVLGLGGTSDFDDFRKDLIGTTAIRKDIKDPDPEWGKTCSKFLKDSKNHASKASATYYYKSHLQYFEALYKSTSEIYRVTRPGGIFIAVVQDSYYKEIHNDVPEMLHEMATKIGFSFARRDNFNVVRTFSGLNPKARKYVAHRSTTEAVIVFKKI